jgi:regulator of replication initiation timing
LSKSFKVETVALVQQRQRYELQLEELEDEVSGLQAQLRQNTERSTKLRLHHEKYG